MVMTLGITVDDFLYHNGPAENVQINVEALNAVWSVIEERKGIVGQVLTT